MITIDKKHKKEIDKLKKIIVAAAKAQDELFNDLCAELNVDANTNEGDCLFDYIFNDCDFTVKFKK